MPQPRVPLDGLKISFIAGTLGIGGAERQLFYIAKFLKSQKAEVTVLCLTQGEFWESALRKARIPVIWVGKRQNRLLRLLRITAELKKICPDVIHSQHFYTNLYAAFAGWVLGKPSIGSSRNDLNWEIEANGSLLGKLSASIPTVLAANTKNSIRLAERLGISPEKLFYLPNVLNVPDLGNRRQSGNLVNLLAVGRLTQEKGYDRLIRILDKVARAGCRNFKATIIGDGPLKDNLKLQARDLGLIPKYLEFRASTREIETAYQSADMLLLTSDYEGTPNVVLEAMAFELPVVATKVGGIPEILQDGYSGFIIEPQNEEDFANSVIDLINDDKLRSAIGNNAKKYIQLNHRVENLLEYLPRLYERVLSRMNA